jgi:cystathionine gamma-synthase
MTVTREPTHSETPPGASTTAVHGTLAKRQPHANRALITPLLQTATYTFADTADLCRFQEAKLWGGGLEGRSEYARYGNPTVRAVEKRLAALEHAGDALLFPSGMAAITQTLLTILPTGAHVILTDDCYRKTAVFCETFLKRLGISHTRVPAADFDALTAAIRPETRIIFGESPTNPYLRVTDLERLAAIAAPFPRIKTVIDATFATPINLNPLDLGINLVIHSATKYLSGHNDILAGVVAGEAGLLHALRQSQGVLGSVVAPQTALLLERGLKTLALRVGRQNATAQTVAEFLAAHSGVAQVWYPGLAGHPDHAVARRQMRGFGGVVSFTVRPTRDVAPLAAASRFIDALTLPHIAASLGGTETLVEQPALMSYFELSTAERGALGIHDNLVRLALGIEDSADILADLAQALEKI